MNSHVSARHLDVAVSCEGDHQKIGEYGLNAYRENLQQIQVQTTPILARIEHLPVQYLRYEAPHPIFNPSVVNTGNQFIFMSRCSSLRKIQDLRSYYASQPHDTKNILHFLSHGFQYCGVQWLDDTVLRTSCPTAQYGVEDCRLFVWQGELWAIGAAIQPSQEFGLIVTQLLFKIQNGKVIEFVSLPSPHGLPEKNWIPHVSNERLFLVYSLSPTIVYEYRDGKIYLQFKIGDGDHDFDIRGGTQLVPWNGCLLGIAHAKPFLLDKYYYFHKFVVLDKNLNVLDIGEPFFIQKRGIEFACGLARSGDNLILSYGVSDRASAYCVLPPTVIDRWVAI